MILEKATTEPMSLKTENLQVHILAKISPNTHRELAILAAEYGFSRSYTYSLALSFAIYAKHSDVSFKNFIAQELQLLSDRNKKP